MKILILTQYFTPETGAPQNRLLSLAKFLDSRGHELEVVTAMPNYPKMKVFEGYRNKFYANEFLHNISIHRSYIFASKNSGLLLRLLNYFSFVLS